MAVTGISLYHLRNYTNEDMVFLLFTAFNGDRETSVHDIYFSPPPPFLFPSVSIGRTSWAL